jgi:uncharacterized protein (UPF0212 family)
MTESDSTELRQQFHEYDAYDTQAGYDQCPICGNVFPHDMRMEPVCDKHGREYEQILDTDPADGPFYCPECWERVETARKTAANTSLGEFA